MATTTTNFGWDIPQSTDLVKDGATAIAALGQDIDTAFIDLKGGTTGQVLAKASNTDLDYSWVAQDDSNAIQNAIVDAKGDLIAASAADTPARLAVGTNGQVLTADSTEATGLKWTTVASGSTFVGARAQSNANQTISNETSTILNFGNETFDTSGFHDNSTNNSRMTVPSGKAGYYLIQGLVRFPDNATGAREIRIDKNGSNIAGTSTTLPTSSATASSTPQTTTVALLAVGDYVELACYQSSGGNLTITGINQFNFVYLGA
jgi:hypothetical protein